MPRLLYHYPFSLQIALLVLHFENISAIGKVQM